jgi:amino acid transporter, AAT family
MKASVLSLGDARMTGTITIEDVEEDKSNASSNVHILADGSEHRIVANRLERKLSARQVQMIAIGGTIGTGLFLGTGKSLATGGPASMLIAYVVVGAVVFLTMLSLGEMAAYMPVAGSLCTYAGYGVICSNLHTPPLLITLKQTFCR